MTCRFIYLHDYFFHLRRSCYRLGHNIIQTRRLVIYIFASYTNTINQYISAQFQHLKKIPNNLHHVDDDLFKVLQYFTVIINKKTEDLFNSRDCGQWAFSSLLSCSNTLQNTNISVRLVKNIPRKSLRKSTECFF